MRPTRLSGALLVLGLMATIISSAILFSIDAERRELDFQRSSASVLADIQATFDVHSELIEQLAAVISIVPSITRNQFARFIATAERAHSHPAIRAVEWIPAIRNDLRYEFEQRAIADGFENFQITQRDASGQLVRSDDRLEYHPVFYVEPMKGNEAAVGFDLSSNSDRLAAISSSIASRAQVATSPIELVQRQGSSFGFLIFSPVYTPGDEDLLGFALGVFDVDASVGASLLKNHVDGIDFTIIDEDHSRAAPILNGTIEGGLVTLFDLDRAVEGEIQAEIALPNRTWTLTTGKAAGAFQRNAWLWAVPVLAVIASVGFATSAQTIEHRRRTSMLLLESEYERAEFDRRIVEQELEHRAQKTRMIDSVSHELRTPLTVITARADLLSRKLPDATERQTVDLESIKNSAKQLKEMIDSLIEYSTINSDFSSSNRDITDINDVVNQAIVHFNSDDLYKRLVINIPDPLLGIHCDRILIRRALIELIENADKYGREGTPIKLSVVQEDQKMIFEVENSGDEISIGEGISLFQPLARGSVFGDASQPGIGLGLAFVRTIAEVHNGEATFSSSPDGTNVFGFEISE